MTISSAAEYEEEWEKCVELALNDRGGAYVRARELLDMSPPKGEVWHIPIAAVLVFPDIKERLDATEKA